MSNILYPLFPLFPPPSCHDPADELAEINRPAELVNLLTELETKLRVMRSYLTASRMMSDSAGHAKTLRE